MSLWRKLRSLVHFGEPQTPNAAFIREMEASSLTPQEGGDQAQRAEREEEERREP